MTDSYVNTAAGSRILTLVITDLVDPTALKTRHCDRAVGDLIERRSAAATHGSDRAARETEKEAT